MSLNLFNSLRIVSLLRRRDHLWLVYNQLLSVAKGCHILTASPYNIGVAELISREIRSMLLNENGALSAACIFENFSTLFPSDCDQQVLEFVYLRRWKRLFGAENHNSPSLVLLVLKDLRETLYLRWFLCSFLSLFFFPFFQIIFLLYFECNHTLCIMVLKIMFRKRLK